jgi:hypothetical protein
MSTYTFEPCDCIDCQDNETPCYLDCDFDSLCQGCHEALEAKKDLQFDIKCAQGCI